jgi:DNA-binding transcriptional LysR family regulator
VDVRQLRMLRALSDLGSVRAVAEALHITPSAVSQQLRLLQRRTAVPLTRRDGRRLVLTEAGQRLATSAIEVEAALARAEEAVKDLTGAPRGTVVVAGFSSAAMAFFPPLVEEFTRGGAVEVRLADEDVPQEDFPRLTAHYDVVLGHRFGHTEPWPRGVSVTPLLEEPLDVALPAGHPLAAAPAVTAADAASWPWITTHEGWPVGALVDALAAVAGRHVDVVHRVNEFTVVGELVRAGAGLALLPRWTGTPPAGVVLRPLSDVGAIRRIDALSRPENTTRPEVRSVLEGLSSIAAAVRK